MSLCDQIEIRNKREETRQKSVREHNDWRSQQQMEILDRYLMLPYDVREMLRERERIKNG